MTAGEPASVSLEFLAEPAFLLARNGNVLKRNAAAHRLLGDHELPFGLLEHVASSHDEFRAYLRRASGSTAPIVGTATFRTASGAERLRVNCARLSSVQDGVLVLRCLMPRDDRFSLLQRRVEDLNAQLRRRQREKAVLEETLQANRTLLRELQHRVKNSLQMMVSLIQISAKGKATPEVREVVELARLRVQAMAVTQEAIYRSQQLDVVAVRPLLTELVNSIGESFGASLHVDITDAHVDSDVAHSLALITNELTTNAIRHGRSNGQAVIRVSFKSTGKGWELAVQDDGPGMLRTNLAEGSGLKLVRSLCRQIGGALQIENDNGVTCTVRIKADLDRRDHAG